MFEETARAIDNQPADLRSNSRIERVKGILNTPASKLFWFACISIAMLSPVCMIFGSGKVMSVIVFLNALEMIVSLRNNLERGLICNHGQYMCRNIALILMKPSVDAIACIIVSQDCEFMSRGR